jgi:hypothetical protein
MDIHSSVVSGFPPTLTDAQMLAGQSVFPATLDDSQMEATTFPKTLSDSEMQGQLGGHGPISAEEIEWYKKKGWPYPGMEQDKLIAEKPDQATIDRMRQVEYGKPSAGDFIQKGFTNKLIGLAEAPVSLLGGLGAIPVGYGAAAIKYLWDIWKTGGRGGSFAEAEKAKEKWTEQSSYQPTTEEGQALTLPIAYPIGKMIEATKRVVAETPAEYLPPGIKDLPDEERDALLRMATEGASLAVLPKVTGAIKSSVKPIVGRVREAMRPRGARSAVEPIPAEPPATMPEPKVEATPVEAKAPIAEPIAEAPAPQKAKQVTIAPDGTTTITFAEPPPSVEPRKIKTWTDMVNAVPKPEPPKPRWTEIEPVKPTQPPVQMPVKQPTVAVEPRTAEIRPATPSTPTVKQPWEMTRAEFAQSVGHEPMELPVTPLPKEQAKLYPITREVDLAREVAVTQAIRQGKPVPPEVLADYPDLAKSVAPTAPQPTGEPLSPPKPTAIWPPKREKSPARDRSEMTGLEAWGYDNKMGGLPRKKYEPPRLPRPTEEQSFAKEVRRHYSNAFDKGEISWDKLTPDEISLLEKSFAPEEIAAFKAKPTVEILPEFTEADAIAKAEAEKKVKRDRYQDLPENLTVSPEWLPEYDKLITPALAKAKIKPEHQATATLLLKHGFSMKKVTGKDPAKAMEHYLNSIKPRLRASERFPEGSMPIKQTEEGALEIEPTAEMAKGEARAKGKNIIEEPSEVEAVRRRRDAMVEEIVKEVDAFEAKITDPKEKEMFRTYRKGLSGAGSEKDLAERGIKVSDDTYRKRAKQWENELREIVTQKAEGIIDKVKKEIEFDDNIDELADKGISKDYENWQKQREGGFVVVPVPGRGTGATAAKVKNGLNNFYQDVFDRFHAIKSIAQIAKDDGINVPVHKDPYIKARNYLGVQAMAEEKIFYRRFKIDENTGKVVWGEKSLQDIVKSHKKEMDKWDTYLVARHSPEVAVRGLKTGRNIAVDKAFVDKYAPQFEADAKDFTAYHNSLLKELVDAGRLKEETYRELTTRYPNYASFNRVIDEVVEHGYVPSSAKLLSKIPNPIKRLKGSERPIISPTESAIKATYVITNVAERQRIAKSIFDLREQSPELKNVIKLIKPKMDLVATLEDGTKIFRPSSFQKEGVIEYFEKGQRHFYEVPKDIYESMSQLTEAGHSWMIKILATPSRLLRAGATLTPDFFMGTNPFRDQTTAFMNAKYGYVPWFDFAKGLFNLVKKPEAYHAWRASGGEWSMLVALDRATNQATLKKVLGEKDYTRYIKKPWTFLEDVSMYGERPTRLSVFTEARKRGVSDVEAAFQSREASTDFARRGAAMKSVSAIYTFLNARMQGTDKLIRTFKENPAQAMLKGVSIAALPSLTLYLINRSDDKYWEIPEWQRRMFWMIPVGGGHYLRIPKGEIGVIFGTTTEMIMENLDKSHDTKKRIDQMAANIIKELSPIGNLGEIMPTAFRPIMEWFFNKNFFTGQPVVSRSNEGIKPEYQYGPRTSETAKAIGKVVGASPSKIENLGRGYLGGMSNYIFTVGDAVLDEVQGKLAKLSGRPAPKHTELPQSMKKIPVLKTFMVNDPTGFNSDSVTKFYDAFGKLDEFKRTFDKLKKQGQTDELKHLVKSDPLSYKAVSLILPGKDGDTTLYKDFSKTTTALSDYRKKRISIIESSLPMARKEELINKLDELILQSVIPVLAKYRGIESWLKKGKEND